MICYYLNVQFQGQRVKIHATLMVFSNPGYKNSVQKLCTYSVKLEMEPDLEIS
jgi:hypothetical protein